VTYHHCHASLDDLTRRVAAFQTRINQQPCGVADRLWEGLSRPGGGETQVLKLDAV
jgi:hypothetical protein